VNNTVFTRLAEALRSDRPVALVSVVDGAGVGARFLVEPDGSAHGHLGNDDLHRVVLRDALGELAAGRSGIRHYGEHGETGQEAVTVFVESFAPAPQMVIFGAVDFTAALVRVAKVIGYRVTVCDAREVFATTQRFPQADRVVVDWPQRVLESVGPELGPRDAVCVLTHDVRFDIPALMGALATRAGYIGAMGSRRTHEAREERLREEGASAEQLRSIHAPIGLDLGARTPEETAISICAEIIATRRGRSAGSLSTSRGPIH
jgi:xanthine dehydrogenase accessory factor